MNILEDFSPVAVIDAMEANAQEQALLWARALEVEVHEDAGVTWFVSGLPFALCNGIVRARFSHQRVGDEVDAVLAKLNSYKVPMACVVMPSMRPEEFAPRLQRYGWKVEDEDPAMALDLHKLVPSPALASDIQIRQVENETQLKDMIRVLVIGSELPANVISFVSDLYRRRGLPRHPLVRFYVAYRTGEAVATAMLSLGGGVAGIYNVATLEQARRQGIGSAITRTALQDACALGYRIGVLQSSPMGLNVYRQLGFEAYCTFRFFFHT